MRNSVRATHPVWRLGAAIKASILLLVLGVCTGCGFVSGASHPAPGPCVVEIDVSRSVQHVGLLRSDWIRPFTAQVASSCSRQVIHTHLIGANSQAGTCPGEILSIPTLNGNPSHDTAVAASRKTDLTRGLRSLVTCGLAHKRQSHGTDLFGGFTSAGQVARDHVGAHIFVLSDMVEDQGRWNFYLHTFNAADNKRLLAEVKRARLIPAGLSGAVVTVFGMGVGALNLSPRSLSGMYNFWSSYFVVAGAKLEPEVV